jgi:hypothetical protein|tara:strand:- start:39 stop:353 length:315 start_codon:yes stop_codon:yes gene_type:complete
MDIALLRDILIIFGIISGFIFLLTALILLLIIFIRVKKIIRYIEGSINEIDSLRTKIKESVPKPLSDIINGVLTIKKFTESLTKKTKKKKKTKSSRKIKGDKNE